MLMTKRKPAGVREILIEEFMEPMGLTKVCWPKRWVCIGNMSTSFAMIAGL